MLITNKFRRSYPPKGQASLDDAGKASLEQTMEAAYPDAALKSLIAMSADAIAAELAAEAGKP